MTLTDAESRRTDNQGTDKNAPNAPRDEPPPEGEEVVNMFFTSKFWVIYDVNSTQSYCRIPTDNPFKIIFRQWLLLIQGMGQTQKRMNSLMI